MKLLLIFALGIIILVGAIVLNAIASKFGLVSWYEFLRNPSSAGTSSYIWLFFVYPLALGILGYFGFLLLKL